ncbi:hypothetical protein F7725_015745 [Dissostichus mawsoni]|uniref:Secreted protein n=1 Tax=Dissostichus mawsoni TaxID=36200 RepID=A0A7J5YLR6_DISMA|nr:hypothetical protein F7725_015745 [Dissostichus mawsoni]
MASAFLCGPAVFCRAGSVFGVLLLCSPWESCAHKSVDSHKPRPQSSSAALSCRQTASEIIVSLQITSSSKRHSRATTHIWTAAPSEEMVLTAKELHYQLHLLMPINRRRGRSVARRLEDVFEALMCPSSPAAGVT